MENEWAGAISVENSRSVKMALRPRLRFLLDTPGSACIFQARKK